MNKKILAASFIIILMSGSISIALAWGVWGHKHISKAAVFALPQEMRVFYYNHIDYITEASVVPDLRKYVIDDKVEGPRHYVDIENFGKEAIHHLPKTTKEARATYDNHFLNKTGYLPWYIQTITEKLTKAFKKKNKSEILFLSAELSHYLADAHMPLHTSSNHDGQKTNQKGIHALWESMLPKMFGQAYNFKTENARYIKDIPTQTWQIIKQSHSLVDTLLSIEKEVRNRFDKNKMYKRNKDGNIAMFYNSPIFSDEYMQQFHTALNGMVEQQLRLSIFETASFWYTAWVNGGSPDLLSLDDAHLTKQNRKNYRKEIKKWKKGKLLNLSLEKE